MQFDGTPGGDTTLLPDVVGSPCALKVTVEVAGAGIDVWTARLVEVVEALPIAAGVKLHTTVTVKVVPGGTAPDTTFFTVRVGAVCAPLSVLPIRGTPVGEDHGRQQGPASRPAQHSLRSHRSSYLAVVPGAR